MRNGQPPIYLREWRTHRTLSVSELAERSGLSERAIFDIENGRTENPHPRTLRKLAEALGTNPHSLRSEPPALEGESK